MTGSGFADETEIAREAARGREKLGRALAEQKKFADARLLWGNNGADVGGDTATFAKTITPYSVYEPRVGSPTEIKVADGKQYVNVAATLHVKRRDNGLEADRNGAVMLYRSVDPHDKNADKRDWKIRGIDIRVHD